MIQIDRRPLYDLSVGMSKYIKDLQDRKRNETELQVRFEAPNKSTIASQPAKKTKVKKHLSIASPSGTYERESRWEGATLQIVKLTTKLNFICRLLTERTLARLAVLSL